MLERGNQPVVVGHSGAADLSYDSKTGIGSRCGQARKPCRTGRRRTVRVDAVEGNWNEDSLVPFVVDSNRGIQSKSVLHFKVPLPEARSLNSHKRGDAGRGERRIRGRDTGERAAAKKVRNEGSVGTCSILE